MVEKGGLHTMRVYMHKCDICKREVIDRQYSAEG
jgi:hypothetical protein